MRSRRIAKCCLLIDFKNWVRLDTRYMFFDRIRRGMVLCSITCTRHLRKNNLHECLLSLDAMEIGLWPHISNRSAIDLLSPEPKNAKVFLCLEVDVGQRKRSRCPMCFKWICSVWLIIIYCYKYYNYIYYFYYNHCCIIFSSALWK